MTTHPAVVRITLPELTDTEAAHLHEALHELLLIVDAYYADPGRRLKNHPPHQAPSCVTCPLRGNYDDDGHADGLPF